MPLNHAAIRVLPWILVIQWPTIVSNPTCPQREHRHCPPTLQCLLQWFLPHLPNQYLNEMSKFNFVLNKSNISLDSNKSTNFNKKSHFKAVFYELYNKIDFTLRYDSYNINIISYNSWALTIRRYNTNFFTHDTYHVLYDTNNYAWKGRSMVVRIHRKMF